MGFQNQTTRLCKAPSETEEDEGREWGGSNVFFWYFVQVKSHIWKTHDCFFFPEPLSSSMTFVPGKDIQISWSRQTCSGNIALVLFAVKESKPYRYLQWKQYWTQRQHKTKRTAEFYDRISHWVQGGQGGVQSTVISYFQLHTVWAWNPFRSGVMTWSLESKGLKKTKHYQTTFICIFKRKVMIMNRMRRDK